MERRHEEEIRRHEDDMRNMKEIHEKTLQELREQHKQEKSVLEKENEEHRSIGDRDTMKEILKLLDLSSVQNPALMKIQELKNKETKYNELREQYTALVQDVQKLNENEESDVDAAATTRAIIQDLEAELDEEKKKYATILGDLKSLGTEEGLREFDKNKYPELQQLLDQVRVEDRLELLWSCTNH